MQQELKMWGQKRGNCMAIYGYRMRYKYDDNVWSEVKVWQNKMKIRSREGERRDKMGTLPHS